MRAPFLFGLLALASTAATAFLVPNPASFGRCRSSPSATARIQMVVGTGPAGASPSSSTSSSRRGLLEDAGKMGLLTLGLTGLGAR